MLDVPINTHPHTTGIVTRQQILAYYKETGKPIGFLKLCRTDAARSFIPSRSNEPATPFDTYDLVEIDRWTDPDICQRFNNPNALPIRECTSYGEYIVFTPVDGMIDILTEEYGLAVIKSLSDNEG